MTAPYLGHLVRLAVPMQGHAAAQATAAGTLTDGGGSVPFPQFVTANCSFVWDDADLQGTGVWRVDFDGEDFIAVEELTAHRYATVRVEAIISNTPNLIVNRPETDIQIDLEGGNLREHIVVTGSNAQVFSYVNNAGLKITTDLGNPEIAWNKREYSSDIAFYPTLNLWGIGLFSDWPGSSSVFVSTGTESIIDSFNATNSGSSSATYTAWSVSKIGTQFRLTYIRN